MNLTSIEWTKVPGTTGMTWNPIRATLRHNSVERERLGPRTGTFCTRISPGCKNCYASTINRRFGTGLPFEVPHLAEHEFYIDQRILEQPLRRKSPATIFVGDMFDLFHEAIDVRFVGRVFGMMAKCPQHTFQLLTKRADRMHGILSRAPKYDAGITPLPNVWLGVSVESQKYANERITLLQETPAAVRFLSVEPMLKEVDLSLWLETQIDPSDDDHEYPAIDWVICGGESGPGARPFNLDWANRLRLQCSDSNVPFFMKQVGSNPVNGEHGASIRSAFSDSKGGDMSEWPICLRVRQWPKKVYVASAA